MEEESLESAQEKAAVMEDEEIEEKSSYNDGNGYVIWDGPRPIQIH